VNILVLGAGAREHAFIAALAKSPAVHKIFACPGNPGMDDISICKRVLMRENPELAAYFKDKVDLAVVGSAKFVKNGTVDALVLAGIPVIGPAADAGAIENSKAFAYSFMAAHSIPSPVTKIVANYEEAESALNENPNLTVVKCDGFAHGTGVAVCKSAEDAKDAAAKFFKIHGPPLILQEKIEGTECSYSILTDGNQWVSFSSCRDYKLSGDGDTGTTTGGMGAISPSPDLTPELEKEIISTIVQPVVNGMKKDNLLYRGFLSIQLMLSKDGPKVLEFNARLGDPEAQTILSRFRGDLADLLKDCSMGCLTNFGAEVAFGNHSTVSVILARAGYPENEDSEPTIKGIDSIKNNYVFFSNCKKYDNKDEIAYKSGRLICITAIAKDLSEAREKCYDSITQLQLENVFYRKDIGLLL
jgi:phosphoribosylamine---glycine ligase